MFTSNHSAPNRRPLVTDLMAPSFVGVSISLVDLHRACLRQNIAAIENRTFLDCRLEGPAVMLALDGLTFDNTDFGYAKGDIRNLVLFPASPSGVIGAVPMRNCVFKDSEFYGVGFTGSKSFTDQILALRTAP
jgi:hypothetical protein